MVSKGRLHGDFISLAQEMKMNAVNVLCSPFFGYLDCGFRHGRVNKPTCLVAHSLQDVCGGVDSSSTGLTA